VPALLSSSGWPVRSTSHPTSQPLRRPNLSRQAGPRERSRARSTQNCVPRRAQLCMRATIETRALALVSELKRPGLAQSLPKPNAQAGRSPAVFPDVCDAPRVGDQGWGSAQPGHGQLQGTVRVLSRYKAVGLRTSEGGLLPRALPLAFGSPPASDSGNGRPSHLSARPRGISSTRPSATPNPDATETPTMPLAAGLVAAMLELVGFS
jgi:hypothetical protein